MANYTDVFGSFTVPPAEATYSNLVLVDSGTLAWPGNFSGQVANEHLATSILEISASSPGLQLAFPPANEVGVGQDLMLRNVGAEAVELLDAEGGPITVIAAGEAKYFYTTSNITAAGAWSAFTYGAGTSGADAAQLAGAGLEADGSNKLRLFSDYRNISTDSDVDLVDREKVLEITAGSITLTLPAVASAGAGFSFMVHNSATGSAVIEGFGSETVDGSLNKTLFPGESCIFICNGSYWISVGYGRDAEFVFSEVVVDAALGNITLTSDDVSGRMIRVAGTATGNVVVTLPSVDNIYFVTVGAGVGLFTVEFKTSLVGSTMTLTANQSTIVYSDGTNVGVAINTTLTSTLSLVDGSATSPSIKFSLDTDTGIYRSASGQVSFSSNGVAIAGFNSTGLFSTTPSVADNTTKAATTAFVQSEFAARSITAGNGLTGGGTLAATRTVTLGTPSTLTGATTNAVTGTTHTHALTLDKADVGLANVTNDAQLKIASDLSDLNDAATARTNLGLGTAATATVTTSATDTTAGRLLKVGDFGVGGLHVRLDSLGYTSWKQIKDNNLGSCNVMANGLADGPTAGWLIGKWECNATGLWGRLTVSEFTSGNLSAQRTWVSTLVSGVWSGWNRVYQQGDILGTVSQSSGVPTGAIIERGSNANGEYIRFADGTQICTHEAAQVSSITLAYGALYTSAVLLWTFPASFISTPKISGFNRYGGSGGAPAAFAVGNTASTTNANFLMIGPSSATNYDQRPVYIAIGRWY